MKKFCLTISMLLAIVLFAACSPGAQQPGTSAAAPQPPEIR